MRSLQRRLAEERTRFQEVLELARRDVACGALADEHVPLAEIALHLGYSEQSAFTRAFRCGTGLSPSEYRELHVQAEGTSSSRRPP